MSDRSFRQQLNEALADPERADYVGLRCSFVLSEDYRPWLRDQESEEELHMRMTTGAWESAQELAEELLELEPLSIATRLLFARSLREQGREMEASFERMFAQGLLRAVLRSGDGHDPEHAIVVLDIREMSLVLDVMGLRTITSKMSQHEGRWIDQLRVSGPEGDRTIYFDIDLPQGWLQKNLA